MKEINEGDQRVQTSICEMNRSISIATTNKKYKVENNQIVEK